MPTHNPAGAFQRLLTESVDNYGEGKNAPGECLRWNYFAQGAFPNLTPAGVAIDAWIHAPDSARHEIGPDTVVPGDYPIILGPVSSPRWEGDKTFRDGDVVTAGGAGVGLQTIVGATDWPSVGVVGTCTLEQRAAQTHRPVLGYLTSWLGYDLESAAAAPATPEHPTPKPLDGRHRMFAARNPKGGKIYNLGQSFAVQIQHVEDVPDILVANGQDKLWIGDATDANVAETQFARILFGFGILGVGLLPTNGKPKKF